MGAALCAAAACKAYASLEEASGVFSKIAYVCQPDASKKKVYADKYELYKSILNALEPIWGNW
jgi:sugar (pentulose or hexulose) kinase